MKTETVRYRTKNNVRYKETLLGTITGHAARLLNEANERGESLIHRYDTNNMELLKLWRTEVIE